MKSFFDVIAKKTTAELMVWSFVAASLIGGTLLYITEYDREVVDAIPVMQTLSSPESAQPTTSVTTTGVVKKGESYIDSIFMAVSALCVTGLSSTDFSQYTLWGQIVLMILIQIGGFGVIVFTSFLALLFAQSLSSHSSFKEALAGLIDVGHDEVKPMLNHILHYTLCIQGFAFVVMGSWLQRGPLASVLVDHNTNPRRWSLFHTISAFNNAGFTLFNDNLVQFATDPVIALSIASLIILGGIGYPVLIVIHRYFYTTFSSNTQKISQLHQDTKDIGASSLQMKVALYGTAFLLAIGTMLPYLTDMTNAIYVNMNRRQILMTNFFQSVSTRTAGFNTIDIGGLSPFVLMIYIILMYIGACPAGTGGGVKIPTIAVLLGYMRDRFHKPGEAIVLFGEKVSKFALSHAVRLLVLSLSAIALCTLVILFSENVYMTNVAQTPFSFLKIYFEVVSAFATVGLSMGFAGGVTSFAGILSIPSKVALIVIMLIGRVGPLTVLAAIPLKKKYNDLVSSDYEGVQKLQIG